MRNRLALSFWCWILGLTIALSDAGMLSAVRASTVYEVGEDPQLGFNLISWWEGTQASHWENAINNLHAAGFREISISPLRFVSTSTGALTTTGAPSLSGLASGVARAKALGMRVTLNPFVEPVGFSTWRGFYNPVGTATSTFWSGYEDYLVEVAEIAALYDVDAMTVGTELRALTRDSSHNAAWYHAINVVDAIYDGQLGYGANWDNFNHSNVAATIWSHPAIDFLGIDSYFDNVLTGYFQSQGKSLFEAWMDAESASASSGSYPNESFIDLMTAAWTHKLEHEILPFASAQKDGAGLPVVFTEIGYLARDFTALMPQNEDASVDPDEQIMAFNGLLNALDGRGDVFHALHVWQWGMAGSGGSLWNINSTLPADQPQNLPLGKWLADFVGTAVLPIAGDYNRDGAVDAADYTVWRDSQGARVLNFATADANGDGLVDEQDYAIWKANFGSTPDDAAGGLEAAVPEPTSWILTLAMIRWLWLPRWQVRERGQM